MYFDCIALAYSADQLLFALLGKVYYQHTWVVIGICLVEQFSIQPVNIGRKESIMSDKSVKIYSLSTCSHCKSTKKFLAECTIKYDFVDVDLLEGDERKAILEDVKKMNPKCSFPTIIIGEKVIVGYKEEEIKEALGL